MKRLLVFISTVVFAFQAYAETIMGIHEKDGTVYGVTTGFYTENDLENLEKEIEEEGYQIADSSSLDIEQLGNWYNYDYLLLKDGLLYLPAGQLCKSVLNYWECSGDMISKEKGFKVLVYGTAPPEDIQVDMPFCSKRCYDARALIYNAPINWSYSDGEKQFNLEIKKGLILTGLLRPYGNGCLIQGTVSLCINSGTMTLSFRYPDGHTYSVSAPVQMKYWNSFRATINPNMIGLFVRQHGTDKATFNYKDLGYDPVDNDEIGYVYNTEVTFKRISNDPYEWAEISIQSGQAKQPFCGEEIALCRYNYLAVHSWKEDDRIYYGAVLAKNIDDIQKSSSLYRRNGAYETIFNTGDLYVGNDEIKAGVIGYWKGF